MKKIQLKKEKKLEYSPRSCLVRAVVGPAPGGKDRITQKGGLFPPTALLKAQQITTVWPYLLCRTSTAPLWWRDRTPEKSGSWRRNMISAAYAEKWVLQACFCYLARQINRLVHVQDGRWDNRPEDDRPCRRVITAFTFAQWTFLQFVHNTAPSQLWGWWNVFKAQQIRVRCTLTCTFPFYSAGTESSNNKQPRSNTRFSKAFRET